LSAIFSFKKLILNNLNYYRKSNVFLILSIAVTVCIITGSFIIGDSIKYSLVDLSLKRIGKIEWSLHNSEKYFTREVSDKLSAMLNVNAASLLILKGTLSNPADERFGKVQVNAIDENFRKLSLSEINIKINDNFALINEKVAGTFNLKKDDEFVLRLNKINFMPYDSPFSKRNETIAFRLKVLDIVKSENFGNFTLKRNHVEPLGIFVSLDFISNKLGVNNKANTLLTKSCNLDSEDLQIALNNAWGLEDSSLFIVEDSESGKFELRSQDVFISDKIAENVLKIFPDSEKIFSYFVNEIRKDNNSVPYSFVTSKTQGEFGNISDNEIIINSWLAEDIQVKENDNVEIEYYVIDDKRKLIAKKENLKVKKIISVEESCVYKTLVPDFPGLDENGGCKDWKSAIPIDLNKIREKDEQYWNDYKKTPKAFISFNKAQLIWGNQFGKLTGIRFPIANKTEIIKKIKECISPNDSGFYFQNERVLQKKSLNQTADFSKIFIGLSFFITGSSLLLTFLLFNRYIESRISEIGTLQALGFNFNKIKLIFLTEGAVITVVSGIIGIVIGIIYDMILIYALKNIWNSAIRTENIHLYLNIFTIFKGFIFGFIASIISIYLSLRNIFKNEIAHTQSNLNQGWSKTRFKNYVYAASVMGLMLTTLIVFSLFYRSNYTPVMFYVLSVFFLIEGLLITSIFFHKTDYLKNNQKRKIMEKLSVRKLGIKNIEMNALNSLLVVMILSIGIYIVISITLNRHGVVKDLNERNSGTGGFNLFLETTYPIKEDLNSLETLNNLGFNKNLFKNTKFVQMRAKEGDDASCLNLNRAVEPQILGINLMDFSQRKPFGFAKKLKEFDNEDIWSSLDKKTLDGCIPAIADQTVIQWGLGKKVGDVISVSTDSGKKINLKLVAGLNNSILQGYIIISEKYFLEHFSGFSGFRIFLADNCKGLEQELSKELARGLFDYGVEISNTKDRLNEFNSVENTYLSIFSILGGLGVLLGTLGFGVVLSGNMHSRFGELALLRAIGYSEKDIKKMIVSEYMVLLMLGVLIGTLAGFLSVSPVILASKESPYVFVISILGALITTGIVSIKLSANYFAGNDIIQFLREE